jgi:hypothetical protein
MTVGTIDVSTFASRLRSVLGIGNRASQDFDEGEAPTLFLHGKGDFLVKVGSTSQYQTALQEIASGGTDAGGRYHCIATLLLDDGDSRERHGVTVEISGRRIGYLSGHVDTQYREWLWRWRLAASPARCRCLIAQWSAGESGKARYNVTLDLEIPFKMTTASR